MKKNTDNACLPHSCLDHPSRSPPILNMQILKALSAIGLLYRSYASVYDPAFDCSDTVYIEWPSTGEYDPRLLEELHAMSAGSFRDEARSFVAAAKAKLPIGTVLKPSEMTGSEIDQAKLALRKARFSDFQAEICRDVSQLHSLHAEAAELRATAKDCILAARSRLLPGTVIALKDIKGPEMDQAKRAIIQARTIDTRIKLQTNLILMKRARYDRKMAAVLYPVITERLAAVRDVLAY